MTKETPEELAKRLQEVIEETDPVPDSVVDAAKKVFADKKQERPDKS